jgi:PAS domain S-box-containing protein
LRNVLAGVLYLAVYVLLGWIFAGNSLAQSIYGNTGLLLLPVATCVVILRRRRQWLGAQRLFWDAFLIGLTLWILGHIGWILGQVGAGRPSWVQWHTMFSLCGGLGPLVAFLARPHRGARETNAAAAAVELVTYGMFGAFLYAYFLLVPSVVLPTSGNSEGILLWLVQVQRLLLVAAVATALWFGRRTSWAPTYQRLALGIGVGFFLRLVTSVAISRNTYHLGTVLDFAWLVPFLGYLWAAIDAPASAPLEEIPLESSVEPTPVLLSVVPLLAVPLVGYGLLRVQPLGDPGDSFRVLLTTMTIVCGVGLLTLRLAVQRGELQRADARVRLLAAATEQTGDLILITRADGTFEHANDACLRALGYARADLAGMNLAALLDHGGPEQLRDHIGREVRLKGIWRGTLRHKRRDGSGLPVSSTVVALRNESGGVTHFVGVERDITEDLRLRDQLVHSERLSAIGELVAGVAHEINNPLQTIVGCVELLLEEQASKDDQRRDLQLVRQEAARAGQIVRNLLAFVRRGSSDRVAADLNQIVRATADLREYHLIQRNITLLVDLQPGLLPIFVSREEIQQVVLNLVMNAEHAIGRAPGAGTIVMRTQSDGRAHTLQVSDDGPGISPELRGRVFEPFFTTKDVGEGTGLGLSISLGIATAHGGALTLCDTAKGACFQLMLPTFQAVQPTATLSDDATARQSRVLVVEDEASIRGLLARLLSRRGHTVIEAPSVPEALRLIESDSFDVVLCDLTLGDESGLDCLRRTQSIRPDLAQRFVFVTGAAGAASLQADQKLRVLAKPFTAADLERVLADVIAAPQAL